MKRIISFITAVCLSITLLLVGNEANATVKIKAVDIQYECPYGNVYMLDSEGNLWVNERKIDGLTDVKEMHVDSDLHSDSKIYAITTNGLVLAQYSLREEKVEISVSNSNIKDAVKIDGFRFIRKDNTVWEWDTEENKVSKIEGLNNIVQIKERLALDIYGNLYYFKKNYDSGKWNIKKIDSLQNIKNILDKNLVKTKDSKVYDVIYSFWSDNIEEIKENNTYPFVVDYVESNLVVGGYDTTIARDIDNNYYIKGPAYFGEAFNENPIKYEEFTKIEKLKGFKKVIPNYGIDSNGNLLKWGSITNNGNIVEKVDEMANIKEFHNSSKQNQGPVSYRPVASGLIVNESNEVILIGQLYKGKKPGEYINLSKDYGYTDYLKTFIVRESTDYEEYPQNELYVVNKDGRVWHAETSTIDTTFKPNYIDLLKYPIKIEGNSYYLSSRPNVALNENGDLIQFRGYEETESKIINQNIEDFTIIGSKDIIALTKDKKLMFGTYDYDQNLTWKQTLDIASIGTIKAHSDYKLIMNEGGEVYEVKNINDKYTIEKISGISNAKKIITYRDSKYVLTEMGEVFAWGENRNGQLGLGHEQNVNVPTKITNLPKIKELAYYNEIENKVIFSLDMDGYVWRVNASYPDNIPKKLIEIGKVKFIEDSDCNILKNAYSKIFTRQDGTLVKYDTYGSAGDVKVLPIKNAVEITGDFIKCSDNNIYINPTSNVPQLQQRFSSEAFSKEFVEVDLGSVAYNADINGDGNIDVLDLSEVAASYNVESGQIIYKREKDINRDDIIDLYDLVLTSKKMGK